MVGHKNVPRGRTPTISRGDQRQLPHLDIAWRYQDRYEVDEGPSAKSARIRLGGLSKIWWVANLAHEANYRPSWPSGRPDVGGWGAADGKTTVQDPFRNFIVTNGHSSVMNMSLWQMPYREGQSYAERIHQRQMTSQEQSTSEDIYRTGAYAKKRKPNWTNYRRQMNLFPLN